MPEGSIPVVVVPVYNDAQGLETTINSLQSRCKSEHRIIVVDNDSTDQTLDVARSYGDASLSVYTEAEIQGSYAARNRGIGKSNSNYIGFLDADETVDDDWLETALKAMNKQDVDYLGCSVELTLPEDTFVGRYNARTGFPVRKYLEEEHYAPTCALLVKREVFDEVGPFDARLISGGDRQFGERVHEAGYDQGYAEDATVYHPARTTFRSLGKKNFRVGRGFCQMQRYYPERYGDPGIPPRPSRPSGDRNAEEPESVFTRIAFAFVSIAMLACRGMGYYYEFSFGKKRDDIPGPTS